MIKGLLVDHSMKAKPITSAVKAAKTNLIRIHGSTQSKENKAQENPPSK
jgi:hypothetical protein